MGQGHPWAPAMSGCGRAQGQQAAGRGRRWHELGAEASKSDQAVAQGPRRLTVMSVAEGTEPPGAWSTVLMPLEGGRGLKSVPGEQPC